MIDLEQAIQINGGFTQTSADGACLWFDKKYGIVNLCLCEVLGDLYMAYSASPLALEYQNGNPKVRGKDSVQYIKLGDLLG